MGKKRDDAMAEYRIDSAQRNPAHEIAAHHLIDELRLALRLEPSEAGTVTGRLTALIREVKRSGIRKPILF